MLCFITGDLCEKLQNPGESCCGFHQGKHGKKRVSVEHTPVPHNYETTKMYPEFADIAQKEGFPEIAKRLRATGRAEAHHEKRYAKLLEQVKNGTVFKKSEKVAWV